MKSLFSKLFVVAFTFYSITSANAQATITLHTIGDSTMATYDENITDKRGWGMMFQQFFTSDVVVNNRAKSGASSKSYYEEGYWDAVKQQIETGDYVIIQFAHNDEKNGGYDGDEINATDYRGTSPQGTYKEYFRLYIDETLALGATPILATAICRRYFSSGTITRKGRHDLGENFGLPETDHSYDYSFAMQEVATEMGVQLIDLTSLTKDFFESYGDAASEDLFCSTDSTHLSALGGTLVARLCVQEMTSQNILANYINDVTNVLVNPVDCDFGDAYTGQTLTKELTITGFDLEPASGTFVLSVDNGFLIAANETDTFASSITMDYAGGNLEFSKFYISISQSVGGIKEGALTVTNGTLSKETPLIVDFVELTGGTEVNLRWELATNENPVITGGAYADAVAEIFSEMAVNNYSVPHSAAAVWPNDENDYDATTKKTQRNKIEKNGVWPAGEIDEVSTRYIEFGITAKENTELNIDNINLYVGAAGGSGMSCRISYSIDDFVTTTIIDEFLAMVAYQMYRVLATPVVNLKAGESLKLRVYPWYSIEKSGPLVCLAEVNIHGIALSTLSAKKVFKNTVKWIVGDDFIKIKNAPVNSDFTIYDLTGRVVYKSSNNLSSINI